LRDEERGPPGSLLLPPHGENAGDALGYHGKSDAASEKPTATRNTVVAATDDLTSQRWAGGGGTGKAGLGSAVSGSGSPCTSGLASRDLPAS